MEDSGAAPTFLTFTTLSDMNSDEARTTVASHAARIGRQRRRMRVVADPQNISHSFHLWRAFGYAATSRRKPRNDQRSEPEREPEREPEWPAAQAPPFYGNPLSLVGQGRKDPFAKFAVPHISDLGQEVLDHAMHHFWPGLSPARGPNPNNPVNEAYIQDIRSSPLAFYAYLVGSAENYELVRDHSAKTKAVSQLCLSYRVEMIGHINHEIQTMTGPPSDELLGAIVVLAANSVMFAGQTRCASFETLHCSRFRSPLRTAQFIHVYSARPFISPHTQALLILTMKKGGCSAIKSPGVASVVGLCDLVHASQTNSQLLLLVMSPPPLRALQDVRQFLAGCDDHRPPSITLWDQLPVEPVRKTALLRVVEAMLTVTDALEHYLHGSTPPIALADIINARNDAQYLLLCLPPAFPADIPTLSDSEALSEHIYEILRIALRIYSNLVLFPMNPAGGTSRILAAALKVAMTRCGMTCLVQSLPKSCLQPLLWALMLGGLQSDDGVLGAESERVWYLEEFGTFSQLTGIRTWEQVIASHSAIMWSDLVLTVAAFEFWSHSDRRIARVEEDGLD